MSDVSKRRRFIGYVRVSKVGDREGELLSPEIQRDAIDAYAERHDIDVIEYVEDLNESGRSFERRAIKDIIQRIEHGEADGVLLWKWSRWGRNVEDSTYYLGQVKLAGGEVRAATEDIDARTAIGQFQLNIQHSFNQFQSDLISETWRVVQARRINLQLPAGGAPPLGYRAVVKKKGERNDEPFLPDPVYGPVVQEMYEMYLRGVGPHGIAKTLNDRGLKTPKHSEKYGGKPFGVPTIARALDSGFAAGYITRHGKRVEGAHESLIDDATWQAYLRERERRRVVNPKSRQPKWLLGAGLAVCGRCNGNLVVDSYRSRKSQAICSTYKNKRTCDGAWVDRVKLETLVALWLGGHVDEWTQAAEAVHDVDDERAQLTRQIDRERAAEAKLRDGLRRAARLVSSGDMTDEDYGDAKREADTRLREVTARLADLQSRLDALDPAGDAYERLARALGRAGDGTHTVTQPVDVALDEDTDARVQAVLAAAREHGVPEDVIAEATTEQVPAMAPEEWHALLRRVIKRVVVEERHIVIEPWIGDATTYDRAVVMPPRKRSDVQVRDEKGRFVKGAA